MVMKTGRLLVLTLALIFTVAELMATEELSRIGQVTEIKLVDKYIYLKLDEQGKENWLATLKLKVSPGDEVEYRGGDIMEDFYSKALDKTFESIRFVTQIRVIYSGNASTDQAMPSDEYHQNIAKEKPAPSIPERGDITRVEGSKTIEEIFAAGDQLSGKKVVLNAAVVKVSKNILGKNWITLQDGTGTTPNDRIVATTLQTIKIGETFTIEGIIRTDVNLGAGYIYRALLDDAKFTQ
jgi:hypothetical protein